MENNPLNSCGFSLSYFFSVIFKILLKTTDPGTSCTLNRKNNVLRLTDQRGERKKMQLTFDVHAETQNENAFQ